MEAMNRIKEIDGADFVAVVEPGVITGDLQSAARRKGLYYPPDPASLKNCSIGGNIATNAGGPRCLKYGVTRHYVLGLEVVLANGAIVRMRRPHAQEQDRLRPGGAFCRLGGLARRRDGGDFAASAVSACSRRPLRGLSDACGLLLRAIQAVFPADFFRPPSKWPTASRLRPPGSSNPAQFSPGYRAFAARSGRAAGQRARRRSGRWRSSCASSAQPPSKRRRRSFVRKALGFAAGVLRVAQGHRPEKTQRRRCRSARETCRPHRVCPGASKSAADFPSRASDMPEMAIST